MEFRLVFLPAIAAGLVIFGCAGSGSTSDQTSDQTGAGDAGKGGDSGENNSPEGPAGPAKSPPTSPRDAGLRLDAANGGGGGACGSSKSAEECTNCCFSAHPKGADTYEEAAGECACDQPGTCANECANSFCGQNGSMPQAGDSCDQCLSGASDCVSQALSACQSDPDCQAMLDCMTQSGCQAK